VFDPVTALDQALAVRHDHQCAQSILTQLVAEATTGGVPPHRLGLTGSASFHQANLCNARDLDLLLLPPARFTTLTAANTLYQPLADLDTTDPRRRRYLAERMPLQAVDTAETRRIAARRLDVGWAGPVRIDLIEVADPGPGRRSWWFDQPVTDPVDQVGLIATVGYGYPFPVTLVGSCRPILVFRRGWQGVLRPGDHVTARGLVLDDDGTPVLAVDNRPDHALSLLSQPAGDEHHFHYHSEGTPA
jgi:hypothetical protein